MSDPEDDRCRPTDVSFLMQRNRSVTQLHARPGQSTELLLVLTPAMWFDEDKKKKCLAIYHFQMLFLTNLYEGRSKSSYTDTVNYEIRISYFVTFWHILLQLKCTWSRVSPKFSFRCRRIVVLGLPSSHLTCTKRSYCQKLCSFMNSFSLGNKTEATWSQNNTLDHTSAEALPSKMLALNYSFTHRIRHSYSYCTANGSLEDQQQQFFYNGIRALEKCWTRCISVAGKYVEKWRDMICVSRS